MTDISDLIVGGDCHGRIKQIRYLYSCAYESRAQAVFVVGDFGFWEHEQSGVKYLDTISKIATVTGIPLYWLDGNHENHRLLHANYGDVVDDQGFWVIREGCYYAPRGHRWEWGGRKFLALGGATSTDISLRVKRELTGAPMDWDDQWIDPPGPFTMWWPEESLTDEDVAFATHDRSRVDVMLTHDKPRASTAPDIDPNRMECWPNQDRVSQVMQAVKPALLIHGHLHRRYDDQIRASGEHWTQVKGLGCESNRPRTDSWVHLKLAERAENLPLPLARGVA